MLPWFTTLHPIVQALLAGLFTWFITATGASLVFFTKKFSAYLNDAMLGFAAGVMIAASIWSLLLPAIELSEASGSISWLPPTVGFLLGVLFLRVADQLLPHLHPQFSLDQAEGLKTSWQRSTLLVLAITLHNIPEGLAVGVAFGALQSTLVEGTTQTLAGAMMYVVVEELIPQSHYNGHEDVATTCTMAGFVVMMVLDVALG